MNSKHQGKLILLSIPGGEGKQAVLAYLTKLFRRAPQEKIIALIEKTPAVLSKNISAHIAEKIVTELKKLGAIARFLPHDTLKQSPVSSKKRQKSRIEELREPILNAFQGNIPPVKTSFFYKLGLMFVAFAMILLPLLYLALIGGVSYGVYWHSVYNVDILHTVRPARMAVLLYTTPLIIGGILILFMIKPILVKRAYVSRPRKLYRHDEPLLFAFIEKLCKTVGAPSPQEILVDLDVNASAGLRLGIQSFFHHDLTLTIGLPLIAGMDLNQFAGVLAHEFGHFTQTAGMRCWYIIESINDWFARVVYERDEWDVRLHKLKQTSKLSVVLIVKLALFFVWLSRKILWGLMLSGHAVSGLFSRQMEYNADSYAIHLIGADVFESTERRLVTLSLAQHDAFQELWHYWEERRLADNFPALILANEKRISDEELQHSLKKYLVTEQTGLFDTHPSSYDRIMAARESHAQPQFVLDFSDPSLKRYLVREPDREFVGISPVFLPAFHLFQDFMGLTRTVSLTFYRKILGQQIRAKNLIPVDSILDSQNQEREYDKAFSRYFQGQFRASRPLQLGSSPIKIPSHPRKTAQVLAKARKLFQRSSAQYARLLEAYDACNQQLLNIARVQTLINTGFQVHDGMFGLTTCGAAGLETTHQKAKERFQRIDKQLSSVERIVRIRIAGALQLFAIPAVTAKVPDGIDVKQETVRLLSIVHHLEASHSVLQDLTLLRDRVYILAAQHSGNMTPQRLPVYLRSAMIDLHNTLTHLHHQLLEVPYPFEENQETMTAGDFVIKYVPEEDDLGGLFAIADHAIDAFPKLYIQLISRVVYTAEFIEDIIGLPRLPEPSSCESSEEKENATRR